MVIVEAKVDSQFQEIEELYLSAFPECERKPFSLMVQKNETDQVDIWRLEEDGVFCGLVITMNDQDLVLIDYLAIAPEKRGCGCGSKAIELIREVYPDRRVFLEIESTSIPADNQQQRISRKHFYLKNGLKEMGIEAKVFDTEMELLTFEKKLTFEEYWKIYANVYGEEKAKKVLRLSIEQK